MPLINISMKKGNEESFILSFINEVHVAMTQALGIPPDDKNIRVGEYAYISFKPPYQYLIEISMFQGRSNETKKLLFKHIVDNLNQELQIPQEQIFVLLNDQPLENWGIRGGIPANEVDFGFQINK